MGGFVQTQIPWRLRQFLTQWDCHGSSYRGKYGFLWSNTKIMWSMSLSCEYQNHHFPYQNCHEGGGNTLFSDTPIWNKQLIEQRRTKLNRSQSLGKKIEQWKSMKVQLCAISFLLFLMVVSHSMLIPCYHSMFFLIGGCVFSGESIQHANKNQHMFIDL